MLSSSRSRAVLVLLAVSSISAVAEDPAPAEDPATAPPGIAFRLAETAQADGLVEAVVPGNGRKIYLHSENVLTDDDVTAVCFARDPNGEVEMALKFEDAAATRLAMATRSHIGKPMAILLDGKVITAPVVRSETSGSAQISGQFSNAELLRIFSALILHADIDAPADPG